jgi:hypothetical protein
MADAVVFGILSTKEGAKTAMDQMKLEGFRNGDISVLFEANPVSMAMMHDPFECLAGIGILTNPGLGPFIAAGTIMAQLSGEDSVIGGLTGALVRIGIPESEATQCAKRLRDDGILLSFHADDSKWIRKAMTTLEEAGADHILETRGNAAG